MKWPFKWSLGKFIVLCQTAYCLQWYNNDDEDDIIVAIVLIVVIIVIIIIIRVITITLLYLCFGAIFRYITENIIFMNIFVRFLLHTESRT